MPPSPPRTLSAAPALVRLLASLGGTELPLQAQAAQPPLADRLSQWLSWTDAVTLASVLGAPAPAAAGGARMRDDEAAQRCRTLRAALSAAIAADPVLAPARPAPRGAPAGARHPHRPAPEPRATDADFAVYRQSYLALQQLMDSDIGDLRTFLRARLAASSPAQARLAVLDAALERSLAARERSLFGAVPGRLAARFEQLRRAALAAEADHAAQAGDRATPADPADPADPAGQAAAPAGADAGAAHRGDAAAPLAWLDTFRKDLQSVLLAELEVRFQPVEGLLSALHAR
ncbi:DUF3348 domain-containing protein [Burkholderia glumae]|uniref:DUF3348 domain-containing protein n=1 Tax=Burkholderia glumae TaxID=337 RepID=UPI00203721AF|nr:DUF3348 domain-containing protein [Burkholderia glumae]MCM2495936.1 DUF3348 domain-containing protein [Burkholderia glumae]MCM2546895.1 DUF3348 domain-containing protein [Burkholderia glumae]